MIRMERGFAILLVGAALIGCSSGSGGDEASPGGGGAGNQGGAAGSGQGGAAGGVCTTSPAESAQNQIIFDGLKPSCEGCHSTGSRGYFASLSSFESLLVYQPSLVTPGNPDGSRLVQLLEGNAPGNYKQMPTGGPPYAEVAKSQPKRLQVQAVRDWITRLESHTIDPLPSIDAPRVTRIGAADAQRALYQQLGLGDDDFFVPATQYSIVHKSNQNDNLYPLTSADSIPAPYEALSVARFASLGGGSAPTQIATDGSLSPAFVGSLTQVSQRWCALALAKQGNTALLPAGASTMAGSSNPAAVKAVLRSWFLHFHAVAAKDEDIDRVFTSVFVPLEQGKDTATAYAGTCSYFVRHPDWVFY
jgi:hypothetical protein